MALPGVFHHVHKERAVPAVPAEEIKAVEPLSNERIDHSQPEIFKARPNIERACKRSAVHAGPVRHHRQAERQLGHSLARSTGDSINDERIR